MASVSAFSIPSAISRTNIYDFPPYSLTSGSGFPCVRFQLELKKPSLCCTSSVTKKMRKGNFSRFTTMAVAAEEETSPPTAVADQAVSVAVSPSDKLIMYLQAEGTMPDSAIPAVTKVLQELDGVTDLKVKLLEGIASVELTKQTTVQATGVASTIVELIQGSGFKLQTLNLSFEDEENFS